jgi:NAD-dependent SIR2 family protein deacetylase
MSVDEREPDNVAQAQGDLLPLENPQRPTVRRKRRANLGAGTTEALAHPNEFDQSSITAEEKMVEALCNRLRVVRTSGKVPLFVLGAGISADRVPLLKDIADWFLTVEGMPETERPGDSRLNDRLMSFLKGLSVGDASRADVAELFSTLQWTSNCKYSKLWRRFSKAFLMGPQPKEHIPSLKIGSDKKEFIGLLKAKSTNAHRSLAEMLCTQEAHLFSLNFDGLTVKALIDKCDKGIALHTRQQVRAYFSATEGDFVPSVIKVRGDVFYATCAEPACPASNEEHPLDRLSDHKELMCPACGQDTVVLQFSFPGYRVKEEVAYPILWEARRFLAQRLSAIIIIGLSGRWDRYLLDFLFDLAIERGLVVADVNPEQEEEAVIDSFRQTYYPSCKLVAQPSLLEPTGPCYLRIHTDADTFFALHSK